MAGRKDSRRTSKEHLALAVRKDFNAAMINEPDAITSFLYAAHSQGCFCPFVKGTSNGC